MTGSKRKFNVIGVVVVFNLLTKIFISVKVVVINNVIKGTQRSGKVSLRTFF